MKIDRDRQAQGHDVYDEALAHARSQHEELLKDLASRVRWEEFPGVKLERFQCLLAVAVRSLWCGWASPREDSRRDDLEIRKRLNLDWPIPGGWSSKDLKAARKLDLYQQIKARLEEEMLAAQKGSFRSLSDGKDPASVAAARSMRLLIQTGSERTRAELVRDVYARAHPVSQPNAGIIFQLPAEWLERQKRSEEFIEATGVKLLPEGEEKP